MSFGRFAAKLFFFFLKSNQLFSFSEFSFDNGIGIYLSNVIITIGQSFPTRRPPLPDWEASETKMFFRHHGEERQRFSPPTGAYIINVFFLFLRHCKLDRLSPVRIFSLVYYLRAS